MARILVGMVVSMCVVYAAANPDCHGESKGLSGAQVLILEPSNNDPNMIPQDVQEEPKVITSMRKPICARNEVFSPCKSECQRYCDLEAGSLKLPNCNGKCKPGCTCKKGYVRPPKDAPFNDCITWTTCYGLIEEKINNEANDN